MATWGMHLRIAEGLLNEGYNFDEESFVVGNIGPDCGVPNEDWSKFTPPTEISHWTQKGKGDIDSDKFFGCYLSEEVKDIKEKSFLVGYYTHLLTDIKFSQFIKTKKETDNNYLELKENPKFIWTIKKDWYDLDRLYFKQNPNSVFHRVFQHVKEFPDYLEYYPEGAIIKKVRNITAFYQKSVENLDREYKYLTSNEMDSFIESTLQFINNDLKNKLS